MSDIIQLHPDRFGAPARRHGGRVEALLIGVIAAALLAQAWIAWVHEINWDEFYFLSRVMEFQRGELGDLMQTFHVHLFGWLTALPGNEIDRIVAARFSMLAFEAGTLCAIIAIAVRFASRTGALCAAAAYVTCTNVMTHGASFRFDPIATFLLMAALALLTSERPRWYSASVAGILVAVSALVTIKSVLYVPPILVVAVWRMFSARGNRSSIVFSLVVGGVVSVIAVCLLFLFHLHALGAAAATAGPEAFLAHSASSMIGLAGLPRIWRYIPPSIVGGPLLWAGILIGTVGCVRCIMKGAAAKAPALVLLSFLFPLVAILFYRNAYPYYYVFAFAPASVLVAVAIDRLAWPAGVLSVVTAVLCVLAGREAATTLSRTMETERSVVAAVHEIFPEPVPYIDRCSMIGSFPKAGFFMSTWGLATYQQNQAPDFSKVIATRHPEFVLANAPALSAALNGTYREPSKALLPRDAAVLRDNYIRHWGPIWVAGKRFTEIGPSERGFEILVPGSYTVEAAGDIVIDGKPMLPGDVTFLKGGHHELSAPAGSFPVTLRWGDHLRVPSAAAPQGLIFKGFS